MEPSRRGASWPLALGGGVVISMGADALDIGVTGGAVASSRISSGGDVQGEALHPRSVQSRTSARQLRPSAPLMAGELRGDERFLMGFALRT